MLSTGSLESLEEFQIHVMRDAVLCMTIVYMRERNCQHRLSEIVGVGRFEASRLWNIRFESEAFHEPESIITDP